MEQTYHELVVSMKTEWNHAICGSATHQKTELSTQSDREKQVSFILQTGNPNPEQLNYCTNNTEGRPKKELNLLKGIDGEWREKMGMVRLTGKHKQIVCVYMYIYI